EGRGQGERGHANDPRFGSDCRHAVGPIDRSEVGTASDVFYSVPGVVADLRGDLSDSGELHHGVPGPGLLREPFYRLLLRMVSTLLPGFFPDRGPSHWPGAQL